MKKDYIEGRAFVIVSDKQYIPDIDTDMIFHNKHLHITDIDEMGPLSFGNLDEYRDFPQKVKKDDILVVGENFGCGSSRQQAVDCFRSLGVSMILGKSFGSIYFRNAVNSAMPVMKFEDMPMIKDGDQIRINLKTGEVENLSQGQKLGKGKPFSEVQLDVYRSGSLFEYAKTK